MTDGTVTQGLDTHGGLIAIKETFEEIATIADRYHDSGYSTVIERCQTMVAGRLFWAFALYLADGEQQRFFRDGLNDEQVS